MNTVKGPRAVLVYAGVLVLALGCRGSPDIQFAGESEVAPQPWVTSQTRREVVVDAGANRSEVADVVVRIDDVGIEAKRNLELSKELKKKAFMAVIDSKMKKNTSLSKLLGKDRNLAVKNVVWGENGQYQLADQGDSDLSYMDYPGRPYSLDDLITWFKSPSEWHPNGVHRKRTRFLVEAGALDGGFRPSRGGFSDGDAFGLGGMSGKAGDKAPNRRMGTMPRGHSRVKLGSGSLGFGVD